MSVSKTERIEPQPETELVGLPNGGLFERFLFWPFVLVFFCILLFFDPLQRIAFVFGQKAQQWVVRYLNICLAKSLHLLGVSFDIQGTESVLEGVPIIFISNHQSLFDIPILHTAFRKQWPRFVAKKELAKWLPSVSYNLRKGGNGLIDRSDPRQAIPELQALAERMTTGAFGVVIFPEGTRAREGTLKTFRPTGLSTLIQNAPEARIVPVVIDNTWKLSARKFGPVPWGVTVHLRTLSEIDRSGINAKLIVQKAEGVIREALQALRAEYEKEEKQS